MAANDHMIVKSCCKHVCCVFVLCRLAELDAALVLSLNSRTHKQPHIDLQRLSTAAAAAETTLRKHAARNSQFIRTRIHHTRKHEENRRMEIGWQHPEVFPGGPPPVLPGPCTDSLRRSKEIRCIRRGMAASDEDFTHDCEVVLQASWLCGCSVQIGTYKCCFGAQCKQPNTQTTTQR